MLYKMLGLLTAWALIGLVTLLVSEREVGVDDLPSHIRAEPASQPWAPRVPSTGLNFSAAVGRFEADLIEQALEHTHWNKNRAAQLLELNRTTLIEKIKKRGISRDSATELAKP